MDVDIPERGVIWEASKDQNIRVVYLNSIL